MSQQVHPKNLNRTSASTTKPKLVLKKPKLAVYGDKKYLGKDANLTTLSK